MCTRTCQRRGLSRELNDQLDYAKKFVTNKLFTKPTAMKLDGEVEYDNHYSLGINRKTLINKNVIMTMECCAPLTHVRCQRVSRGTPSKYAPINYTQLVQFLRYTWSRDSDSRELTLNYTYTQKKKTPNN